MRRISLIVGILGLGILIAFLINKPLPVESLDGLMVGEVVSISGTVEEERKFGQGKLLIVRDVVIYCECLQNYVGLDIFVYGIVERFPEDLRLRAFRVETLD